jgi:hypothetical protein
MVAERSWIFPLLNGGEFAIVYRFMFLLLGIAGGDQWSLDRFVRPLLDPPYRPSWSEQRLSRAQASEATFIPIAAQSAPRAAGAHGARHAKFLRNKNRFRES